MNFPPFSPILIFFLSPVVYDNIKRLLSTYLPASPLNLPSLFAPIFMFFLPRSSCLNSPVFFSALLYALRTCILDWYVGMELRSGLTSC